MKEQEPMTRIVRPLRGGQITIPAEFRKRLGITEESVLQLSLEGRELRLRPIRIGETAEGSAWFRELYEEFAPVREEASALGEDEVDAAIRQAVKVSRAKREAS